MYCQGMCCGGSISGGWSSQGTYITGDWQVKEQDENESSFRSIDGDFSRIDEHMLEGVGVLISWLSVLSDWAGKVRGVVSPLGLSLIFWWVLTCTLRQSLRANCLKHSGQTNLSPIWLHWCLRSDLELVKRFSQNGQLQANGSSPVCQSRWVLRFATLL